MKDVFISRPTWISSEFKEGLKAFLNILKSHDLNPRTLGVTDYPTESPLDEIISIINQCVGAIILGYPQIEVKEGVLKGDTIDSSVILATEWNHIEAGLAHAKGLPLIVIHHKGVTRGIFDRGAISKYLYEIDMSKDTWSSDDKIIGVIKTWRGKLGEISPLNSRESSNKDDLEFDIKTGTYISKKTNLRCCGKCLDSTPSKRVPLKEQVNGWRCNVCDKFYSNPNYNPPRSADDDDYDYLRI